MPAINVGFTVRLSLQFFLFFLFFPPFPASFHLLVITKFCFFFLTLRSCLPSTASFSCRRTRLPRPCYYLPLDVIYCPLTYTLVTTVAIAFYLFGQRRIWFVRHHSGNVAPSFVSYFFCFLLLYPARVYNSFVSSCMFLRPFCPFYFVFFFFLLVLFLSREASTRALLYKGR